LRASLLGACDGLISVASLMVGIIAGGGNNYQTILAGIAGTVAGAMSMGAGEYVSVWSMRDAELADMHRERLEFLRCGEPPYHSEMSELCLIYESRGLPPALAREVAEHYHNNHSLEQLVALHAREELGIDTEDLSDPIGVTFASMLSFTAGAVIPLLGGGFWVDPIVQVVAIVFVTILGLLFFGGMGAYLGGAPPLRAAGRVMVGGLLAMGATYGVGKAFGVMAG
ncbi:DUF125-domain-containing protein, partial [Gonapodya prolifera JEL478]